MKTLLSVYVWTCSRLWHGIPSRLRFTPSEGIRAQDLERVLLRATPASGGEQSYHPTEERTLSDDNLVGVAFSQAPRTPSIGSAADPIMVDDDEQGADGSILHPIVGISRLSQFQNTAEDTRQATDRLAIRRMTPFKPRLSIPTDVNVAVPSSFERVERQSLRGMHTPDRLYAGPVIPSCFVN